MILNTVTVVCNILDFFFLCRPTLRFVVVVFRVVDCSLARSLFFFVLFLLVFIPISLLDLSSLSCQQTRVVHTVNRL